MSIHIDAQEVLEHLNQLGYRDITAKQLKAFIRDLKILIKYDLKKKTQKENEENNIPSENYYYPANREDAYGFEDVVNEISAQKDDKYLSEVFNYLYTTSTISSRAKSCSRKENVCNTGSFEVLKPKSSKPLLSSTSNSVSNKIESRDKLDNPESLNIIIKNKNVYESRSLPSFNSVKHYPSTKSVNFPRTELKPKVSFIRPRKPVHVVKSDPVALYQQYQETWNKQKIPGENKRFNLRWAIREKMLGEPDIIPRVSSGRLSKRSI